MCEALLGSWKLVESNSDDLAKYMEACEVGLLIRKAACALNPTVTICETEEGWLIKTETTLKKVELCFKLNIEFDETILDGRKVKTIITCENGVLTQNQKWDGKESIITREVVDGRLVTIYKIEDVTCKRVFDRK